MFGRHFGSHGGSHYIRKAKQGEIDMLPIIAIVVLIIISLLINDMLEREIKKGNGLAEVIRTVFAIIGIIGIISMIDFS